MTVSGLVLELFKDEYLTDKKKKIIEAAIETFSVKGYRATSSREIAKKAGVAEGTIFKYYQTKSDLLLSIIAKTVTLFEQEVQKYLLKREYNSFNDFISTFIEKSYYFEKRYHPVIKIFIQEVVFQRTIQEPNYMIVLFKINKFINDMVIQFKNAGEIIDTETKAAQRMITITIIGLFTNRYFLLRNEFKEELEIRNFVAFLVNGLSISEYPFSK